MGATLLSAPGTASAHPLGNFTVNHYTRIDLTADEVRVFRVLDLAEIPGLQQIQRSDADGDGALDASEREAYAGAAARGLGDGMAVTIGGAPVDLAVASTSVTTPEGQGGLSTLRLEVTYFAPLPAGWAEAGEITYLDSNETDRLGWREVVMRAGEGVALVASDAPAESTTNELRTYPDTALASPPDLRTVTARVAPGSGAPLADIHPRTDEAVRGNPDGTLTRFTGLIARDDLGWSAVALALVGALGFGALHALSPGHGKTIVAAYLVGSRGTWKHALFLAAVVTVTHTSSVYALGFVALYLSDYVLAESLYPLLGLASGSVVLAMGCVLLVTRLRSSGLAGSAARVVQRALPSMRTRPLMGERGSLMLAPSPSRAVAGHDDEQRHSHDAALDHGRGHAAHRHAEPHSHGIGAHTHRVPGQDGERVTLKGLLGLGIFGGMIPCPSAIVVMLSAIALHRVGFGLVLIVAFSLGLASVLTAIGFALVFGRTAANRLPLLASIAARSAESPVGASFVRFVPVFAALAVVGAGMLISFRALDQM